MFEIAVLALVAVHRLLQPSHQRMWMSVLQHREHTGDSIARLASSAASSDSTLNSRCSAGTELRSSPAHYE